MKFTLHMDCDNDAFGDGAEEVGAEIARILRKAADTCASSIDANQSFNLFDANGNVVGYFTLCTE